MKKNIPQKLFQKVIFSLLIFSLFFLLFNFFYNKNEGILAQEEGGVACRKEIPSGETIDETEKFSKEIIANIDKMTRAYLDQENAARELIILTNEENCSSENCKTDDRHCEVNSCPCSLKPCETGCKYWTTEECVEWTCSLDSSTYSSTVCNPESGRAACQSACRECIEWECSTDGSTYGSSSGCEDACEDSCSCSDWETGTCSCTEKEKLKHCKAIPCECEPCPFNTINEQVEVIEKTYEKIKEANEKIKDLIEGKKTWTKCKEKDGNWVQCTEPQQGDEECDECTRTWQEEDWEDLTKSEMALLMLEKSGSELEQCTVTTEMFEAGESLKWVYDCQTALGHYLLQEQKEWVCFEDDTAYHSESVCNDACTAACVRIKTLEEKCYEFLSNYVCCQ